MTRDRSDPNAPDADTAPPDPAPDTDTGSGTDADADADTTVLDRLAVAADVVAIQQVLARYPHAVDDRDWPAFADVFTDDVVCEMSAVGLPTTRGRDALVALFDRIDHPIAHHLVNPVIDRDGPGHATVRSKWLVTLADRTAFGGTYTDQFVRTAGGWRICHRRITPRDAGSRRPVPRYDLVEEEA